MPRPDSMSAELLELLMPVRADGETQTDADILLKEWHPQFPLPWLDKYLEPVGSFHQVFPETRWDYWGLRNDSGSSPEPCPHWLVYCRWRGGAVKASELAQRLEEEGFYVLRRRELAFEEWSETSELATHIQVEGQWQCSFYNHEGHGNFIAVQVQHLAQRQVEFISDQTPIDLPFPPLTLNSGETLSDWQGQDPSDHFSAEFRTVRVHISGAEQAEFAERMQQHLQQAGWQLLGSWEDETSLVFCWRTSWGQSLLSIGKAGESGLPVRWAGIAKEAFREVEPL